LIDLSLCFIDIPKPKIVKMQTVSEESFKNKDSLFMHKHNSNGNPALPDGAQSKAGNRRTFFSMNIDQDKTLSVKKLTENLTAMSIVPLLTEINENGKISFKIQMLRASGKFSTMILVLHKRKHMIYIKDQK
jgi:hypothetical protein